MTEWLTNMINIYIDGWRRRRQRYLIHFVFGMAREQTTAALPTPQYQGRFDGRFLMVTQNLGDNQFTTLGPITFTDKRGNPTGPPAGAQPPVWTVDDDTLVAIAPTADGLSCKVSALGKVSATGATVSVKVTDASGATLASGGVLFPIVSEAPANISIPIAPPAELP